ncbi:hypothetical protein HIM_10900 [Hirsutella minnesotensis 3608]|uniref:Uncharacterized protein n=1 Tax=Hirsutella minnesotensis 3608 TaxID=1043627 RepID=A0A0F7ZFT6_9HYPO|nr:hypothetical protein HIM_10900 [Hirsutella minnesotensis 3608]
MNFDESQWYDDNELTFSTPTIGTRFRTASPVAASQPLSSGEALPLLQREDWDERAVYDESPPTCVHYYLEWGLFLNKGRLMKLTNDTEPNLVLAPGAFWEKFLKAKLEKVLRQKTPQNKCFKPEETKITVSTTERGQRKLAKRFDEMDIDWVVIEDQMKAWSHLLKSGRRMTLEISFIYKDKTIATGTKSGRGAGNRQRAEHNALIEAGGNQPSAPGPHALPNWKTVYNLHRCGVESCESPYCCVDPVDKKHYKVDTSVLDKIIEYVDDGNQIRSFDDIPQDIRDIIFAKQQQSVERACKKQKLSNLPPIHIGN